MLMYAPSVAALEFAVLALLSGIAEIIWRGNLHE